MYQPESPLSLYFHIPFCTHRCAYCDFNTYAGQESLIPAYVDALCKEIEYVGVSRAERTLSERQRAEVVVEAPLQVHTVFFGGGTPSLLSPLQFASIFKSIRATFGLTEDVEITIEANPGTVTYEALCQLREIGINRLSFGVQSANAFELKMLERAHNFFDVIEAVTSARKAGFHNLNLDLIYGLPEQALQTWQTTVKRILDLHPEHISAYALTLEHGTPFGRWASKGLLPLPDPDLAAEMYEWASETLAENGYIQYEISNWAKDSALPKSIGTTLAPCGLSRTRAGVVSGAERSRHLHLAHVQVSAHTNPSFACRHNLQYWRGLPYLAFGAGAHGYAHGYRYSNVLRIKTYIERLNTDHWSLNTAFPLSPVTVNHHKQTLQDDMSEFMMTGLRLTQEGISSSVFERRFGRSLYDVFGKEMGELLKVGLLESQSTEVLRLTKRGRLLGNQVFMRFV
ncbi:MAG TPA: radical SAM family heme chaperone HemW [Anaerolineales bacterium]|nr:radical SAM family heme chaperone HemW [Anaerolineales bacterium]